jgi:hypothetical protein
VSARDRADAMIGRIKVVGPRAVWPVLLSLVLLYIAADSSPQAVIRSSLAFTALVLLSFIGWGSAVAHAVAPDARADIGLRAAWGMGVSLAIGGVLVALGCASRTPVILQLTIGVALFAWHAARENPADIVKRIVADARSSPWFYVALAVIAALLILQCTCALFDTPQWAVTDDGPAYTVFPKQMLQSGTFAQPFSLRRMTSLGGQSFLQAIVMLKVHGANLYVFDRGLCLTAVVMLIAGTPLERLRVPRMLLVLPLLLVVTVENVSSNLGSTMSGLLIFLALYRTLRWAPVENGDRPIGSAALVALLGAGALTLRQNFAAPVIATLVASYGRPLFKGGRPLRARLAEMREGGYAAAFSVLLLVPWAIAAQRSCHSFAYPFLTGNYQTGTGFEPHTDFVNRLRMIWDNVTFTVPIVSIHLFVFAGVLMKDASPRRAMRSLFVGSFIGLWALLWFTWQANPPDFKRYYFAFEMAMVCAVTLAAFETPASDPGPEPHPGSLPRGAWAAVVVVIAMAWQLEASLGPIHNALAAAFKYQSYEYQEARAAQERATDDAYARMQASVPPGAPMFVMLDDADRLDFGRNPIEIMDFPGIVGPGEFPVTDGGEALASYLDGLGLRYFAYVNPDTAKQLYSRAAWESTKSHGFDGLPQQKMGVVALDVYQEMAELAASRAHVFDGGGMTVLDLERRSR